MIPLSCASCALISCDQPTGLSGRFAGTYDLSIAFTENTCDPQPSVARAIRVRHETGDSLVTMQQDFYVSLWGPLSPDGTFHVSGQVPLRHYWTVDGKFEGRSMSAQVEGGYFPSTVPVCTYKMNWTGTRR